MFFKARLLTPALFISWVVGFFCLFLRERQQIIEEIIFQFFLFGIFWSGGIFCSFQYVCESSHWQLYENSNYQNLMLNENLVKYKKKVNRILNICKKKKIRKINSHKKIDIFSVMLEMEALLLEGNQWAQPVFQCLIISLCRHSCKCRAAKCLELIMNAQISPA